MLALESSNLRKFEKFYKIEDKESCCTIVKLLQRHEVCKILIIVQFIPIKKNFVHIYELDLNKYVETKPSSNIRDYK